MANNSSAKKSSGSTSGSRKGTSAAKTSSLRTRSAGRSSGRRSSGKSSQRAKEPQGIPMKREIQLVASFGIMLILMLSNFGLCGVVGVWLSSFFFGILGCVQYVMPVAFFLMVTVLLANDYSLLAMKKCGAGFVVLTMISAYAQLIYQQDVREFYDLFAVAAADHRAGGILGGGIGLLLQSAFGVPGAIVIISCVLLLSLILLTQRSFVGFFRQGMKQVQAAWKEGVQRHRQAAKERETAEDRLREKQCEEKIKEMEEKKAEKAAGKAAKAEKPAEDDAPSGEPLTGREQSGRRMARKKKQPDIRIHIPLFAPEDEVKKKDSLKELHPEFYPFTAEDGKTEAFAGTLDFSTLSLHPEDSDETFADEASEESRMGNTATFADNPAQENRTGKAAIVADDDGEETEEAAQPETAHGLPEEITLSEQLPIEERNTAAVTAADSDIFAVTDAEQSETGYEAVRDLSPVNTDAGDPAPGDVVVATVDRRESAGDAADNRNTVRTDIPENVAPETPASSADTSVVSTGTGAERTAAGSGGRRAETRVSARSVRGRGRPERARARARAELSARDRGRGEGGRDDPLSGPGPPRGGPRARRRPTPPAGSGGRGPAGRAAAPRPDSSLPSRRPAGGQKTAPGPRPRGARRGPAFQPRPSDALEEHVEAGEGR